MQVDWHQDLPHTSPAPRHYLMIHGVKQRKPIDGILVGSELLIVRVHYHKELNRSLPCIGAAKCYLCGSGMGGLLKGYCAAIWWQTRQPFVLEFTESAAVDVRSFNLDGHELRGQRVQLVREGRGKQGRVRARFTGQQNTVGLLPEFDPRPALLRFWGLDGSDPKRLPMRSVDDVDKAREFYN